MALAKKYSKDAAAADALTWVFSHHSSYESKDHEARRQALDMLRRDYLASDKLPPVVGLGADETFLRAVLEKSPHRHIRGLACYYPGTKDGHVGRVS